MNPELAAIVDSAEFEALTAPFWIYDDGGRARSGRKGHTGDCVVRAVAIGTGIPYGEVYDAMFELNRQVYARRRKLRRKAVNNDPSPRTGVDIKAVHQYLEDLGWTWHPTMTVGSGCTVHLHHDELPGGRIICRVSKHVCAMIDGVIYDTHDPSSDGTRCVYGIWKAPE